MRWLEEIRVRTQPRKAKEVLEHLLETAAAAPRNRQLKSAHVYSHRCAPGGFSLVLDWNTASIPAQGSETAMLILEGLKAFGLLDHSVLVDEGEKVLTKQPFASARSF